MHRGRGATHPAWSPRTHPPHRRPLRVPRRGRVLRLTPDKRLSTIVREGKLSPGGLAIHKDGRIFSAAMDITRGIGSIAAVKPDGSGMEAIVPP